MPTPLTLSERALEQHIRAVEASVKSIVSAEVGLDVQDSDLGSLVNASLIGQGCERVSRNRGPDIFVAPLRDLGKDLWAWLGLHEDWKRTSSGKNRRFEFRSIGLTVHFGYRNERSKPQMFRAEWSGWSNWEGANYGFQGGDVGHPHWQYDALESLSAAFDNTQLEEALEALNGNDQTEELQEFDEGRLRKTNVVNEVRGRLFSRIHFPSAAPWWLNAPHNRHTHSPASRKDIESWAHETLTYTVKELERV